MAKALLFMTKGYVLSGVAGKHRIYAVPPCHRATVPPCHRATVPLCHHAVQTVAILSMLLKPWARHAVHCAVLSGAMRSHQHGAHRAKRELAT